jgi:micrococcal nuclease
MKDAIASAVTRALPLLAAALLLGACSDVPAGGAEAERPGRETAVVAAVVDGDTIRLRDGREVRLVQIDAPEGNQRECYAQEARRALRTILPPGTPVSLQADPRLDRVDQYGRLLRYVLAEQRNVNLLLVRRGAASVWFFEGRRGRYASALLRAARGAKAAGRGLWGACPGTRLDPLRGVDTGGVEASPPEGGTCPGGLSWRDARAHVGEQATVEGPVAGALFASDATGQPTFLNLGVDHPDPDRVTVIIWGRDRGRFPEPPETAYLGSTVCVSGRIELYEGVAELEVSSPAQIELAG